MSDQTTTDMTEAQDPRGSGLGGLPCSEHFIEETIDGLLYICDSPPHEYGGFHPNAVQTAKDAVKSIAYLKEIAMATNEVMSSVNG